MLADFFYSDKILEIINRQEGKTDFGFSLCHLNLLIGVDGGIVTEGYSRDMFISW